MLSIQYVYELIFCFFFGTNLDVSLHFFGTNLDVSLHFFGTNHDVSLRIFFTTNQLLIAGAKVILFF
jgi:hypothetical protein